MEQYRNFIDSLPLIVKIILALPILDGFVYGIYRICKGTLIGIILGIIWIFAGSVVTWVLDIVFLALGKNVLEF